MPRILVIEDEPTQRLLTISVLKAAGHQVFEAIDGEAGLQIATTVLPDLIVCDVMMPRLNGYQMVTALKAEAATATIPVIFLSSMSERTHVRVGMSAGADDYLAKPFRASELKQAVDTLLAKRRQQLAQFAAKAEEAIKIALQDQQQALSGKYERQLIKELNQRFQVDLEAGRGLHYADTPVLGVDIFGPLVNRLPEGEARPAAVKRVYEATSDALYLFGAQQLVPFGHHLIAIFADETRGDVLKQKFQAVRAAFAAQKALRAAVDTACGTPLPEAESRALAVVALHTGPVMLMRVDDALHGGGVATIATGEGVSATAALVRRARELQWQVACSASMAAGIGDMITTGRGEHLPQGAVHRAFNAVELLAPTRTPS
jgi:DNA-binding response OmpR family regulator